MKTWSNGSKSHKASSFCVWLIKKKLENSLEGDLRSNYEYEIEYEYDFWSFLSL